MAEGQFVEESAAVRREPAAGDAHDRGAEVEQAHEGPERRPVAQAGMDHRGHGPAVRRRNTRRNVVVVVVVIRRLGRGLGAAAVFLDIVRTREQCSVEVGQNRDGHPALKKMSDRLIRLLRLLVALVAMDRLTNTETEVKQGWLVGPLVFMVGPTRARA